MSRLGKFQRTANVNLTPRELCENQYHSARQNIIVILVCSAVNILMLALNTGTYFLFSASIPYILVDFARFYCGMYPEEYYAGDFEGMIPADKSLFIGSMVVAVIILAIYLLFYFCSKEHRVGFLIAALVFFSIDTLALFYFYGFDITSIMDIVFHGWIIFVLARGVKAHYDLEKLPPETVVVEGEFTDITDGEASVIRNSTAIRPADTDVKARVLMEIETLGHKITYRRIKRTNELVIDGDVYAEYIAMAEMPHALSATIDGHSFEVGLDHLSRSYVKVDGNVVSTKLRVI